jgi:hypothetical protein
LTNECIWIIFNEEEMMQILSNTINSLPAELQRKVFEYIEKLKRNKKNNKKNNKKKFSSLELQKKSLDWSL